MFYVYLLQSDVDHKHYIGQTNNVRERLVEHNSGREKSTINRTPFRLLGYETYQTRSEAMWRERELKKSAHARKKFFSSFDSDGRG